MARYFSLLFFFIAALLIEVAVLPHAVSRVLPFSMLFFIVSMYWLEGGAAAFYGLAAGILFYSLHSASPAPLFIFLALPAAATLFKLVLTHRGPLHLLMFLAVNLVVWQAGEAALLMMRGGSAEGARFIISRANGIDVVFSFGVFLLISVAFFGWQIWGRSRGEITL